MLECGESCGKVCWGRCGKVCWGVGVVKKDAGKRGGGMGNPNTSHKIFPQPPHLP